MDEKFQMPKDCAKEVFTSRFVSVYDLQYAPGKHYYDATRHTKENLNAAMTGEEIEASAPDGVNLTVILTSPGQEPRLYLQYEFRYPAGQYLLSPPAGLVDEADKKEPHPIRTTAVRELYEETGIQVKDSDRVFEISPFVFSSPGMTDESNGLVCIVADVPDLSVINHNGAVGSEKFGSYRLFDRKHALELIRSGKDEHGMYYPVYTLVSLLYFVSGLWYSENEG